MTAQITFTTLKSFIIWDNSCWQSFTTYCIWLGLYCCFDHFIDASICREISQKSSSFLTAISVRLVNLTVVCQYLSREGGKVVPEKDTRSPPDLQEVRCPQPRPGNPRYSSPTPVMWLSGHVTSHYHLLVLLLTVRFYNQGWYSGNFVVSFCRNYYHKVLKISVSMSGITLLRCLILILKGPM